MHLGFTSIGPNMHRFWATAFNFCNFSNRTPCSKLYYFYWSFLSTSSFFPSWFIPRIHSSLEVPTKAFVNSPQKNALLMSFPTKLEWKTDFSNLPCSMYAYFFWRWKHGTNGSQIAYLFAKESNGNGNGFWVGLYFNA